MNKNVALGLEIGIPILLIGVIFGGWFLKNKSDSNAAADQAAFQNEQDIYNSELVRGGKKSKRRKGRKNTSKKKR